MCNWRMLVSLLFLEGGSLGRRGNFSGLSSWAYMVQFFFCFFFHLSRNHHVDNSGNQSFIPQMFIEHLLFLALFEALCTGEGNGNPLQCSCLENPRDGGAWWAAAYGVTQSQTRQKWFSSSKHYVHQWAKEIKKSLTSYSLHSVLGLFLRVPF